MLPSNLALWIFKFLFHSETTCSFTKRENFKSGIPSLPPDFTTPPPSKAGFMDSVVFSLSQFFYNLFLHGHNSLSLYFMFSWTYHLTHFLLVYILELFFDSIALYPSLKLLYFVVWISIIYSVMPFDRRRGCVRFLV